MDRLDGHLDISIKDNQFIEIRRKTGDHTYEAYRLEALPGTANAVNSLEQIKTFLLKADHEFIETLLNGETDIAEFNFNEKHQVSTVRMGSLDGITKAGMETSAGKVASTFQDWYAKVSWSDSWPAYKVIPQPPSATTTVMKLTPLPSTAATATASTTTAPVHRPPPPLIPQTLPPTPPSAKGPLSVIFKVTANPVASPTTTATPQSPTQVPEPQTEPATTVIKPATTRIKGTNTTTTTPRERIFSSPSPVRTREETIVHRRLGSRTGEEFFSSRNLSALARSSSSASAPQERSSQLETLLAAAALTEDVAQPAMTRKLSLSELEIKARVGDMEAILDDAILHEEVSADDLTPQMKTEILAAYARELENAQSPVHNAKTFAEFLANADMQLKTKGGKGIEAVVKLFPSDRYEKIDNLFFKRFTGAAKVVYIHGDFAYMTHKQANKEAELREEYVKTVEMRTLAMESHLEASIERLSRREKTKARKEAAALCKLYEKALNDSENTNVHNASSFLTWLDKQETSVPGTHLLIGLTEKIDESLKYIDVEREKFLIGDTVYYKSKKAEMDLKGFLNSEAAKKLTPEQFDELASSMDEISKAMESIGLLHGDIKPDNLFIYKTTDEQGVDHYHIKVADFGKSALGKRFQLHTGNTRFNSDNFDTLEKQKTSLFYMKMMFLTSNYTMDEAAQKRKEEVLRLTPQKMESQAETVAVAARTGTTPIPAPKSSKTTKTPEKNPLAKLADLLGTPLGAYLYDQGQKEENTFTHAEKRAESFVSLGMGASKATRRQIGQFLMNHYHESYAPGGMPLQGVEFNREAAKRDLDALRAFQDFYEKPGKITLTAEQAALPPEEQAFLKANTLTPKEKKLLDVSKKKNPSMAERLSLKNNPNDLAKAQRKEAAWHLHAIVYPSQVQDS